MQSRRKWRGSERRSHCEGAERPKQSKAPDPCPLQLIVQIFSPPYLFRGARPRISTAPSVVRYNTAFRVVTPDAAGIAKVSLIRLGSVTHGFDMNQRFQTVGFTHDATGLRVAALTSRKRTPPGHYMLFILNGAGVPSVAGIIQIY